MKRFFQRIEAKARDVSLPAVQIVAFGDSVTQGVMEHNMLSAECVYHRLFQARLEEFFPTTSFSTFNAGVSGGNVASARSRVERDVIARCPDLLFIAFGLNDALKGESGLAEFRIGLCAIIREVRMGTSAEIVLMTPPFMAHKKSYRIHPVHLALADQIIDTQNSGMLGRYADVIRKVAEEEGVLLVDIHEEWERLSQWGLDTDIWLVNGLNHPDDRGHKLAANLLFHRVLSSRS